MRIGAMHRSNLDSKATWLIIGWEMGKPIATTATKVEGVSVMEIEWRLGTTMIDEEFL